MNVHPLDKLDKEDNEMNSENVTKPYLRKSLVAILEFCPISNL